MFQTPAPRGGVPLPNIMKEYKMNLSKFQTPAPRGGVPLEHRFDDTLKGVDVSNPCASGRCSSVAGYATLLRCKEKFQTPAPRGGVPL